MLKNDPRDISKEYYDSLPGAEKKNYEMIIFDTDYLVGGEEDVHLFLRIKYAGYLLVMSDKSCFWHKEGATRWNEEVPGFRDKNKEIEQGNYDRFAAKWGYDIRTRGLKFTEEILED